MGDLFDDGGFAMNETPVHEVRVDPFLLARHEVTVAQFTALVAATGYRTTAEQDAGKYPGQPITRNGESYFPSWRKHWFDQPPDHPAVLLSWGDAIAYCNWLSLRDGLPPALNEQTGRLLDPTGYDYPSSPQVNPCNRTGSGHVLRGGQYDADARAAARIDWHDRASCAAAGFRLALTPVSTRERDRAILPAPEKSHTRD